MEAKMLSKSKLGKEEKNMILFTSLGVVFILLGFIIYGFYVDNILVLDTFCILGAISLVAAVFIFFKYSKKCEKELDNELNNYKNK